MGWRDAGLALGQAVLNSTPGLGWLALHAGEVSAECGEGLLAGCRGDCRSWDRRRGREEATGPRERVGGGKQTCGAGAGGKSGRRALLPGSPAGSHLPSAALPAVP